MMCLDQDQFQPPHWQLILDFLCVLWEILNVFMVAGYKYEKDVSWVNSTAHRWLLQNFVLAAFTLLCQICLQVTHFRVEHVSCVPAPQPPLMENICPRCISDE